MKLSEKIDILLKRNGMTQTKLSKELGISQAAIAKWINGSSRPAPDKLLQMSKLFNVSIEVISDDNQNLPSEVIKKSSVINSPNADFEKLLAIRNEIQKVFDSVSNSLTEIDKILKNKKF